jgi:hypothetical protein
MAQHSRREFCKKFLVVLSATPLAYQALPTTSALAQAAGLPTKPLDPASTTAAALGYTHDATKVDTSKFPKRKGPEGEKQFCNTCQFFAVPGLKAEGQEGEWGKCTIFTDGLVAAKGWCNSWTPKAA